MPPIASQCVSPSEAARLLGCTVPHVRLLCRKGKIKAKPIEFDGEKRYRIPLSEIERYQKLNFSRGQKRGTKLVRRSK